MLIQFFQSVIEMLKGVNKIILANSINRGFYIIII
jgi:hypothetical protein